MTLEEDKKKEMNEKLSQVLVDAYLRISALEQMLISKGVIDEKELLESHTEMVSKLKFAMQNILGTSNTTEKEL